MSNYKVLFVCLGNICRSPSAEGVFKKMVEDNNLEKEIEIDSAGTSAYHHGDLPDSRMREHASKRGYNLISRSRPVVSNDFDIFDLIVAMDDSNYDNLKDMANSLSQVDKIVRMTDFCTKFDYDYVPDPYYGGSSGFELVLDILEDACKGLLVHIKSKCLFKTDS